MTIPIRDRAHLVERAVEAFGSAPPSPPQSRLHSTEKETKGPAIQLASLIRAGLVVLPNHHQRSRVAEEMTVIQQQVLRGMEQSESSRNRFIVVTSARPGEGKTFIALNLAACISANTAYKVVLVDADGKRDSISQKLSCGEFLGLRWLTAQTGRASPILDTEVQNLGFLPYGRGDTDSQAVPAGSLIAASLSRLSRSLPQHIFIVDTPPSLSTSDANALSAIAGQVIMVVDAEKTRRNEVEAALDMMEACPLLQLLLNKVGVTANDSFGAYGQYGAIHAG